jgi:hypothetical protein
MGLSSRSSFTIVEIADFTHAQQASGERHFFSAQRDVEPLIG